MLYVSVMMPLYLELTHIPFVLSTQMYQHKNHKTLETPCLAQMLSTTLYGKRFFPYYAFNLLAGIDAEGNGGVWNYDAIGSFERKDYSANGSGQAYVIPLLDNVIGHRNRLDEKQELTAAEAAEILKDAFVSAGERDIYTGDQLEIHVVTKEGIEKTLFPLKAD
jgi:20S proteasome subunit beta 6